MSDPLSDFTQPDADFDPEVVDPGAEPMPGSPPEPNPPHPSEPVPLDAPEVQP